MSNSEIDRRGRWLTTLTICGCAVAVVLMLGSTFSQQWSGTFYFFAIPIAAIGTLLIGWFVAPHFGRAGPGGLIRSFVAGVFGSLLGTAVGGVLFGLIAFFAEQKATIAERFAHLGQFVLVALYFPFAIIAENPIIIAGVAVCILVTHLVGRMQHQSVGGGSA